jgi:hypothetical protein
MSFYFGHMARGVLRQGRPTWPPTYPKAVPIEASSGRSPEREWWITMDTRSQLREAMTGESI